MYIYMYICIYIYIYHSQTIPSQSGESQDQETFSRPLLTIKSTTIAQSAQNTTPPYQH